MDGEYGSPYPHYSWLAHSLSVQPPRVFGVHECRHVAHHLVLTTSGDADIVRTSRGVGRAYHTTSGAIGFFPGDGHVHAMSITAVGGFVAYDLSIPVWQMRAVCGAEGLQLTHDLQAIPDFHDTLMHACLLRLAMRPDGHHVSENIGDEIAARQILLRLSVISGNAAPDWARDESVFTPVIIRQLVACIDAHLGMPFSLETLADTVRLSPGHFARKFRLSVGVSLNRFVNGRRIAASFALLRADTSPLSGIALALGFSSQSHFTRLFSGRTGISPHRFRRLHRRMVG